LTAALLIAEVMIVRSVSNYEPVSGVVFAAAKIPEGTVIQAGMLCEKKIPLSMVHTRAVKRTGDIVGKICAVNVEEGEMFLSSKVCGEDEYDIIKVKDGQSRLFSVEFKGDQANGWHLATGQYVDIMFVPDDRSKADLSQGGYAGGSYGDEGGEGAYALSGGVRRLRNIRIAAIMDDRGKLLKDFDKTAVPKYISFEVEKGQDEFLAYAKSNGRLEISAIPLGTGDAGIK